MAPFVSFDGGVWRRVAAGATEKFAGSATLRGRIAGTWWIGALALGTTVFASGCAAEDPNADVDVDVALASEARIFGGSRDDGESSAAVAIRVGQTDPFELCSGALIAPNVVLTARHCVATEIADKVTCSSTGRSTTGPQLSGNALPREVSVYLGASPRFTGAPQGVAKAIITPSGDELCDSDIALLVLDRRVEGASFAPVRLQGGVSPGEKVRSVGYGQNDKSLPIGTRLLKANVPVLAAGRGVSASQTALGAHEFEVGTSICEGDSGGPAISEQTGAIIGVVSRGGGCGDDFGHIYTSTSGWSELFAKAFEIAGGEPALEEGRIAPLSTAPSPMSATLPEPSQAKAACAASPGATSGEGSALALALAAAVVAHGRRRHRRDSVRRRA